MRNLLAVLLLVLPLGLCKAQTAPPKVVEPTAIGVVYRLDTATQELKKLPSEPWKTVYDMYVEVSGNQSPFRIEADKSTEFVFTTGSPEKVSVYRFENKRNKRRFLFDKSRTYSRVEPVKGLPAEISKYGQSSYKLVPASPLTPGEYVIMIAGEAYTFGVDQ